MFQEFYKHKAREFRERVTSAQQLFSKHKVSIGLIGEAILRDFLNEILPLKVRATQGFIYLPGCFYNNYTPRLSSQCDIIIYNAKDYAPLYSYSGVDVIQAEAVFAVVEVKTSISSKTFKTAQMSFDNLASMGIRSMHLFIYSEFKMSNLSNFLYSKDEQFPNYENYPLYDHGDEVRLPKSITGLGNNAFIKLEHLQDANNDYLGYANEEFKNGDSELSSLQLFIAHLLEDIDSGLYPFPKDFTSLNYKNAIKLYPL